MNTTTIPLVVCVLPEAGQNRARSVSYSGYIHEILSHAGIFYRTAMLQELDATLDTTGLLVTIGEAELPTTTKSKLTQWVNNGGAWLSLTGLCAMDELLGAARVDPAISSWGGGLRSLGEGYLLATRKDHPAVAHITRPIHFFGGTSVQPTSATVLARVDDKHARQTDRPGVLENVVGKGRTMLLAPDITGSIVRIQQGLAVTRDGVPAPDGSGPINDSVLKADDGAVLDWLLDRDPVPGEPNFLAFLEPMADVLRELVLRSIFHLAREQNIPLPLLWLYPRKLPALAHLSHDTDGNEPEKAHRLLELLDEAEVKATWCVILPGYEPAIIDKIKRAGHELATHYDAMTEGTTFGENEFDQQWHELVKMFGEQPVTNKNHYTRWEGDTEFFDWCAKRGIELDQTKGASKTGEAGYNFGTCHVYFPVTFRGRSIDVLEMCLPTQDLFVFAPIPLFEALLATVKKHHGVLHQLYHPAHTSRKEVGDSLLMVVNRARQEGLEWWTAKQINAWERARRTVRLQKFDGRSITLMSDQTLEDTTVLMLDRNASGDRENFNAWGFSFMAKTKTLGAGEETTISF